MSARRRPVPNSRNDRRETGGEKFKIINRGSKKASNMKSPEFIESQMGRLNDQKAIQPT